MEVISCVSGGSIIGAFYYLKLKELLETKPDSGEGAIEKKDYIRIVQETETEFWRVYKKPADADLYKHCLQLQNAVQKELFPHPPFGELYEAHLFKGLLKRTNDEGNREAVTGPVYMKDLFINPKDDPAFPLRKIIGEEETRFRNGIECHECQHRA